MADINLLQNQLKDTTNLSLKRTKIAAWAFAVLMILLAIGGGIFYLLTQDVNDKTAIVTASNIKLQEQVDNQQAGLAGAEAFQAKLSNIELLLKQHVLLTPLLDELAKATYLRAKYLSLDASDETGKIHLEGMVENYNGLAKMLLGLGTSQHFKEIKLLSLGPGEEKNSILFAVEMNATPDTFNKK